MPLKQFIFEKNLNMIIPPPSTEIICITPEQNKHPLHHEFHGHLEEYPRPDRNPIVASIYGAIKQIIIPPHSVMFPTTRSGYGDD
jgi:hypothetical protein